MSGRETLAYSLEAKSRRESRRAQSVRRGEVATASPLVVQLFDFTEALHEGEDFDLSQWARHYQSKVGLKTGDNVLLQHHSGHWILFDIISTSGISGL